MSEGLFTSRAKKGRVRKTVDNALRYLDNLAVTGTHASASEHIGISTGTASAWRKDDGFRMTIEDNEYTFKELCDQALSIFADNIEREVHRRAVTGYEEPVVYKGMVMTEIDEETGLHKPVTVTKFSDRLLEIMLKGQKPKYAGESQININAGENSGVLVVPAAVDQDSWSEQIKKHQAPARRGEALGKEDDSAEPEIDPTS